MSRCVSLIRWASVIVVGVTVLVTAEQQAPVTPAVADRTTSRLNAMTPAQRYHSTLFRQYRFQSKLLDSLSSVNIISEPGSGSANLIDYLRERICSSDATVDGTILSGESNPVEGGSFLFTDYQVRITQVRRQLRGRILHVGETVTVGAPGGDVLIEGQHVRATSSLDPLLERGGLYVLFVRYHAGYRVFDVTSTGFRIEAGKVKLSIYDLPTGIRDVPSEGTDSRRFNQLAAAAAACR